MTYRVRASKGEGYWAHHYWWCGTTNGWADERSHAETTEDRDVAHATARALRQLEWIERGPNARKIVVTRSTR